MGTVASLPKASARGEQTRRRILEVAQDAILAKGFDATSIEEIVAAAEITRSGFFYHFRDKNELARALLEANIELDRQILTDVFRRGHELSDDPLHAFLIGLKLFAELMDDLPNGHPGCIVTTVCYQQRLFDREVRALNRQAVLNWRAHFLAELEAVAEAYPPRQPVDLVALADLLSTTVEGGIVMSKALGEPRLLGKQIMLQRGYIKLLFCPD
ncbi:MAG TPA: TetR/AcrR family transcriptional regulator [Amaricoccus sp.]|nr:TetR/AcrR family transcriptional regulator [Amaricoccus sp.]